MVTLVPPDAGPKVGDMSLTISISWSPVSENRNVSSFKYNQALFMYMTH